MSKNSTAIAMAEQDYRKAEKGKLAMWLRWWFLGAFGVHRFYLGDKSTGRKMLFTLGGCGFWALFDGLKIGKRRREINAQIHHDIYTRYGLEG